MDLCDDDRAVLAALADADDGLGPSNLETVVSEGVDAVEVITRLRERGLVNRVDGRPQRFVVTAAGLDRL